MRSAPAHNKRSAARRWPAAQHADKPVYQLIRPYTGLREPERAVALCEARLAAAPSELPLTSPPCIPERAAHHLQARSPQRRAGVQPVPISSTPLPLELTLAGAYA